MTRAITHVLTVNADYAPRDVNVRITHVNPDNRTVTVEDAIGHVWFGVQIRRLRRIAER